MLLKLPSKFESVNWLVLPEIASPVAKARAKAEVQFIGLRPAASLLQRNFAVSLQIGLRVGYARLE